MPECDERDPRLTLETIAALDPLIVFHESISIRAENVERIERAAEARNVKLQTQVFEDASSWRKYPVSALQCVERISCEVGISDRLHLWSDKALGSDAALREVSDPTGDNSSPGGEHLNRQRPKIAYRRFSRPGVVLTLRKNAKSPDFPTPSNVVEQSGCAFCVFLESEPVALL